VRHRGGREKVANPVDGSENALRALSYVIKRAATDKRLKIYVLNVQPALPHSRFMIGDMIASHHEVKSRESLVRARRVLAKTHLALHSTRVPVTVVP
jgi:hypothetical protein